MIDYYNFQKKMWKREKNLSETKKNKKKRAELCITGTWENVHAATSDCLKYGQLAKFSIWGAKSGSIIIKANELIFNTLDNLKLKPRYHAPNKWPSLLFGQICHRTCIQDESINEKVKKTWDQRSLGKYWLN